MGQIFSSEDSRRTWQGYRIYFYPHEYRPIGGKPLELVHLHFISQGGEVEVYLKDKKNLRILAQWGKISRSKQNEIKKFVKENYTDILTIVKSELDKAGIKSDIISSWQD